MTAVEDGLEEVRDEVIKGYEGHGNLHRLLLIFSSEVWLLRRHLMSCSPWILLGMLAYRERF